MPLPVLAVTWNGLVYLFATGDLVLQPEFLFLHQFSATEGSQDPPVVDGNKCLKMFPLWEQIIKLEFASDINSI